MRTTLPSDPPTPMRTPRSRQWRLTAAASAVAGSLVARSRTSSTPIISPLPRTSPTSSDSFANAGGALGQALLDDHVDRGHSRGARDRVAPERAHVITG